MERQYYRTFIALPLQLETQALEARRRLINSLKGERISWVKEDRFHMTLRFLGDTLPSDTERIGKALREVVSIPRAESFQLNGPSSFGPAKHPRVVWLGFEQTDFFDHLKADVDRALGFCGIPTLDQPFRPHLTLGRVRGLKNLSYFQKRLYDMQEQFISTVHFQKLVFYRSILGPQGPDYHVLEEIKFKQKA